MTTAVNCSWCHAENVVLVPIAAPPGYRAWCRLCGHRADRPRLDCDCGACEDRRRQLALRLGLTPPPAPDEPA